MEISQQAISLFAKYGNSPKNQSFCVREKINGTHANSYYHFVGVRNGRTGGVLGYLENCLTTSFNFYTRRISFVFLAQN